MHLLPVAAVSLEEADGAVDLGQTPGDVVVLSFADSDLSALAVAHKLDSSLLPSLRLANLKQLRHPMSVDLYVEQVVSRAKCVLVRCLGGLDYWRYGLERIAAACRTGNIPFAAMPGDARPDRRLTELSTVPPAVVRELETYWHAPGVDNLRRMLRCVAGLIGYKLDSEAPSLVAAACAWTSHGGSEEPAAVLSRLSAERPLALVLFYRSALLAGDTAPIAALSEALADRGLVPLAVAVSSLKDEDATTIVRRAIRVRRPAVVVATTAFSARDGDDFVLDEADAPVIQALQVGSPQAAWTASARGLGAADLAMQVALPEFDGRIVSRPIAFKEERPVDPAHGFASRLLTPDLDGIAGVADLAAAWVRLDRTPRAERKLGLVLSDYPARGGRAGFAVGLDTPESVCSILDELRATGYAASRDFDGATLMRRLTDGIPTSTVSVIRYRAWLERLPAALRAALVEASGPPEQDPAVREGHFRFNLVRAGNVLIALQPERARGHDRKATYHDLAVPPTHAYLAFYFHLREVECIHALIQLGTHGTTEWLPGKAVALSASCWPQIAIGALPLVYPFIVNDPGEAAPAKRRTAAVTIGHLTPPVTDAGLHGEAATVRELVEELAQAQVLDPRRAALVAREIIDRAETSGLAAECGVTRDMPIETALIALDAHLCDLAELAIRDGLHIFGQPPAGPIRDKLVAQIAAAAGSEDGDRIAARLDISARAESTALLHALDGRFVVPGPAGSPARGHLDALPTGRNLSTLDPRAVPTRTATALGEGAAGEIVRRHLQDTGDWPRRMVIDLWASPTMRSGGEDMAMILALIGVRPTWQDASTRVSGFEIVPLPRLDRPRVDVTIRISGAFRDTFPTQLTLIDQAARAVARLDEDDAWNELAAARRRGVPPSRIFGAAPGHYGAGVARRALDEAWSASAELGRAYLDNTSHSYGGADGEGSPDASFADRIGAADALVHVTDTPDRDILDGEDSADSIGGFVAAAAAAGAEPKLYSLDTSRPNLGARVRTLEGDIARLVRGRLTNPRWIAGQLRHGWRGVSEIAQAVDTLFVFAATTSAVSNQQFDAVFAAYVGDEATFAHLRDANPDAAQSLLDRLGEARQRGLWATRRNSIAARLGALAQDKAIGGSARAAG
jgi:cobaltochelatase CobN